MNAEYLRPDFRDQPVVLVVDDDGLIRNLARITLEREGYFVLTAGNGVEALLLSRQYPGVIHVLLTDFEMPKMNGVQLVEHVCSERPGTQVVLMSGSCRAITSSLPLLQKPFGSRLLAETVRGLLSIYQQQQQQPSSLFS
jgi:DNA-binding NtrC family response regulator